MKLKRVSNNYLDTIRMEREGVERAGFDGLVRGVQVFGRELRILRKERAQGNIVEKSKP